MHAQDILFWAIKAAMEAVISSLASHKAGTDGGVTRSLSADLFPDRTAFFTFFFFLPSNLTVNSNIFNFNTSIYFFTKATDSLVSIVSFFVLNVFLFYLYKRC